MIEAMLGQCDLFVCDFFQLAVFGKELADESVQVFVGAAFPGGMEIFESLLDGLGTVCAGFPDTRRSTDVDYSMADIGLSAFSLFFMQSESFLSHQRRLEQGHGTSNCQTLFGMKKIPTDNYIRLMLDPVCPESLQPCFDQVIEQLRLRDGLKAFQRLVR